MNQPYLLQSAFTEASSYFSSCPLIRTGPVVCTDTVWGPFHIVEQPKFLMQLEEPYLCSQDTRLVIFRAPDSARESHHSVCMRTGRILQHWLGWLWTRGLPDLLAGLKHLKHSPADCAPWKSNSPKRECFLSASFHQQECCQAELPSEEDF